MVLISTNAGCITMNNDNNGLIFEVIALPIKTMSDGR
jgi:hypothetical protein